MHTVFETLFAIRKIGKNPDQWLDFVNKPHSWLTTKYHGHTSLEELTNTLLKIQKEKPELLTEPFEICQIVRGIFATLPVNVDDLEIANLKRDREAQLVTLQKTDKRLAELVAKQPLKPLPTVEETGRVTKLELE